MLVESTRRQVDGSGCSRRLPPRSGVRSGRSTIGPDGRIDSVAQAADLAGLWRPTDWPDGLRYVVRRVKPNLHIPAHLTSHVHSRALKIEYSRN
jgi:hypothetical protein